MTKNFRITVTDAVLPISYLWSIQNAPNVSIVGNANMETVQVSYSQESDLVGGSLVCHFMDAAGCQKTKTFPFIPNNLPTPVNKVYNISCQSLSITDFVGGASVAILSGTHTVMVSNVQFDDALAQITFDVAVTGLYAEADLSVFSNIGTPVSQGNGAYSIDVTQSGSFIITAHLQNTNCDISDVKSVNAVLTPSPIAVNNTYFGDVNSDLTLYPLSNDSDPAGGALSIVSLNGQTPVVGTPVTLSYGTFTLNQDGSISFSPNKDYQGTSILPYTIQSSITGKQASANISISVQCFAPTIEMTQFTAPTETSLFAIYDFVITGSNPTIVCTINGTEITYSNHLEIPVNLLTGSNTLVITATSCDTATFTHEFTTNLPL